MNSMTAYALALEMDRLLGGRTVSTFRRHHSGCFLLLDGGSPSCVQILHNRREAEVFFPDSPLAAEDLSRPDLEQVEGKRIVRVRPLGLDRVILIELEGDDQWGNRVGCTLRMDLAPGMKAVSLFLEPDGRLLGSRGGGKSRSPSTREELPPRKRWSLLDLPAECPPGLSASAESGVTADRSAGPGRRSIEEVLVSAVSGVDPALASMLSSTAGGEDGAAPEGIWEILRGAGRALASGEFDWNIYDFPGARPGGLCHLYPVFLPYGARPEKPADVLLAVAARAGEIVVPGLRDDLRRAATRSVRRDIRRARRLIEGLDADLSMAESARENRHFGNLLSNSRHLMRRGLESISVPDYSTESSVEIPLDPALGPDENIKRYFKKARKGEKGLILIRERRANAKRTLATLEADLKATEGIDDIEDLMRLLPASGETGPGGKGSGDAKPRFRSFRLDDRHVIYVGRNDREN
ncbi:MAG TPA: NFACT family protein, partial [Candidatus Krumholzibacterium sp.]|nr:NFACT family protein [Candidatus Krumholzibacterium sp.]